MPQSSQCAENLHWGSRSRSRVLAKNDTGSNLRGKWRTELAGGGGGGGIGEQAVCSPPGEGSGRSSGFIWRPLNTPTEQGLSAAEVRGIQGLPFSS